MHVSPVHIAGVGISIDKTISENLSVAAGTKALLDAGLTYSDIDLSVTCPQIPRSCLRAFGRQGGSTIEVDNDSALVAAVQYIRSGTSQCALVLGFDQESSSGRREARTAAVAIVLVSKRFLTSRAYLKDSAIQVSACSFAHRSRIAGHDASYNAKRTITSALEQAKVGVEGFHMSIVQQSGNSNVQQVLSSMKGGTPTQPQSLSNSFEGTTGLTGLCGLVWQLRGWTQKQSSPTTKLKNCLQYTSRPDRSDSVLILCRSDSQATPSWDEIEHLRDGRERLAYNPAVEMRDITLEDLQAVVAREGDRLEDSVPRLKLPRKGGDRVALARL